MVTLSALAPVPTRLAVVGYAHRGASAHAPENTLAAFTLAARHGAAAVELDLRRSADGHLVVLHDATPARTTDVAGRFPDRPGWPVDAFTLAELRTLDAGGWRGPEFAGERMPTLAEAMDLLHGLGLGLLLEVKTPERYPGLAGQLARELRAAFPRWVGAARAGRLTVQSFDWGFVRELRAVLPRVSVGLLGAPPVAALPSFAGFVDQINPAHDALGTGPDGLAGYVERVHQLGMAVNVWTVDEPAAMSAALAAGVDGVITNRPADLRAVLDRDVGEHLPAGVRTNL